MGFWGAICSIGSSITSGISSAVGSIGNALVSFASNVGPVIAKIVTELEPVAVALGKFAAAFLQGMGVLKPNEKPEDIGERALQAAEKGVTIEQFDNFDSYLAALRDFDLDAEKAAKRSTAEKLVAGIGVCTIAMERKYNAAPGSLDTLWLLPIANPSYFTPERMQSIVSTGQFTGDVFAYLDKRLSAGDSSRVEDALMVGPGSKEKHYEALDQARDRWERLEQQIESGSKGAGA